MKGVGRERRKSWGRRKGEVFVEDYQTDDEYCTKYSPFLEYLFRCFREDLVNKILLQAPTERIARDQRTQPNVLKRAFPKPIVICPLVQNDRIMGTKVAL